MTDLHRYTGDTDLCVASGFANRRLRETDLGRVCPGRCDRERALAEAAEALRLLGYPGSVRSHESETARSPTSAREGNSPR